MTNLTGSFLSLGLWSFAGSLELNQRKKVELS